VRARVKEKREVARGTLFFEFDVGDEVDFTPGQYFWVEVLNPPFEDERGPRRHISLAVSPTDGVLGLATRVRDTAFKQGLAALDVGDEIEVEEPKGDYVLPGDTDRRYVFIAGGIGITVFRSMLRYIADESLPYDIILVYSNRDRESTAFFDELPDLERRIPGLQVVLTMTGDPAWEGETRRVDADFLRDHLDGQLGDYTYLAAGPPPMVEGIVEMLDAAGVPEEQVLPDRFSGY
jgi:ferredoxin-NADP reductase